jgi:hypothetical protein
LNKCCFYIITVGWLFASLSSFAQTSCATIDFSNDIWDKTDRYYTQGLRLSYLHPKLARPVQKLFPGYTAGATATQASVELFQDLYTPSVYNTAVYNPNDRPYAAVLALNYRYLQQKQERKSTSGINFMAGVIGPGAIGGPIQNWVHDLINNKHALGWDYQIQNGVLVNLDALYEHDLLTHQPFRLTWLGAAQLGTYKTNAQAGLTFYLGNSNASYAMLLQPEAGKKFRHQLIVQCKGMAIAHDATLEGALFQNRTYALDPDRVQHLTMHGLLQYRLCWHSFQFGLTQYIQSPEFDGALWHKWVTIHLGVWF